MIKSEQERFFGKLNELYSFVALCCFVYLVLYLSGCDMDNTDDGIFNRSGLKLHIDAETGIHYLSDGNGGLIIRQGEYQK
jgi:hypothetical protein